MALDFPLDARAFLFTIAAATGAGLLAALVPALQATSNGTVTASCPATRASRRNQRREEQEHAGPDRRIGGQDTGRPGARPILLRTPHAFAAAGFWDRLNATGP